MELDVSARSSLDMMADALVDLYQTCIDATLQNAVAERPRKQFGMYGDDVETHLLLD